MTDEPLIVPLSPGSALVRLSQVLGGIERHEFIRKTLQNTAIDSIREARTQLLNALETGDHRVVATSFHAAQETLRTLYETLSQPGLWENVDIPVENHSAYSLLGFPTPLPKNDEENNVAAVDVSTVIATFSKPQRQILTSLSFADAANSIGYWLIEVRTLGDEKLEEHILESPLPCFRRVRLPVGTHTFKLQTRDHSYTRTSEPFTIEVPAL